VTTHTRRRERGLLRIAGSVIFGGRREQPVEFAAQLSDVPRTRHATASHFVVERGVLMAQQYSFTGLHVFISVDGGHPVITPVTLFRHMKLLGTDSARWTTDPIR
jgi:hypothetical protein